jgi:hypothetical protein
MAKTMAKTETSTYALRHRKSKHPAKCHCPYCGNARQLAGWPARPLISPVVSAIITGLVIGTIIAIVVTPWFGWGGMAVVMGNVLLAR